MNILVAALAVISVAQSTPSVPRRSVAGNGDEIVVSSGTTARIVAPRRAGLRIVVPPENRREVIVLVDEEKNGAAPDGFVDRVYRFMLTMDYPEEYVFDGVGGVEDALEIKEGDLRRPPTVTFVTPQARLRFTSPGDNAVGDAVAIASSGAQSRTYGYEDRSNRTFGYLESVWLNHQENDPALHASVRLRSGSTSAHLGEPIEGIDNPPAPPTNKPRLLSEVKPVYPAGAMRRGVQGRVVLQIVVQPDGTVGDVSVTSSLDPEVDAEAIRCVKQWRFSPATRAGERVAVTVPVEMTFVSR